MGWAVCQAPIGAEPAVSQQLATGSVDDTGGQPAIDTLALGAIDPVILRDIAVAAQPPPDIDPWRNGSSVIESWQLAAGRNAAAQRSEAMRLEHEAVAAGGRNQVSELAYAAAVSRDEVIEQRLTALIVDQFVNGEAADLDQLSGSTDRMRVNTPTEVATETVLTLKQRSETAVNQRLADRRERADVEQSVADEARLQTYRASDAVALDRAARKFSLDHSMELRRRTDATLEASGAAPPTVNVGGFLVSPSIAGAVADLLAAAAEEGFVLGGWGYRTTNEQIDLRMNHCGVTGHAIFDGPSTACDPPTARPLHSQHELGLAIDFTENGAILSASSPAFAWLQENAATYGLFNLPSEPWHWSTTGH